MSDLGVVDPDSPQLRERARLMLQRHAEVASEADVRRAIADFLVTSGLAAQDEIRMEENRIDLQTGDFVIEVKKRIGNGINPDQRWVDQIDGYLRERAAAGAQERLGVLTDGRYWILRQSGIEEVRTAAPYGFEISDADVAYRLYEWLRNESRMFEASGLPPTEDEVRRSFGEGPRLEMELAELGDLYQRERDNPTVAVKRELWRQLLTAALGVVVDEEHDLDRQFLRHTYLSVVVGIAVQAAFGIDVRQQAVLEPSKLLTGEAFFNATGVRGVIESDFFAWPSEVGGERWLTDIAGRVSRFDWQDTEHDVARILYQSVMPAEDRRRLGEYYTPGWLAQRIVDAAVTDPLTQRVLDPACGAGTFLHAAIRKYVEAARGAGYPPGRILSGLQHSVTGVDVHPVAVHLARATWTLAAREVIGEVDRGAEDLTIPVYLGDSLQLRTDDSSLFGSGLVTIEVEDGPETTSSHRRLEFPRALVEQADWFDRVMLGVSEAIENGYDPRTALDDAGIDPGYERDVLEFARKVGDGVSRRLGNEARRLRGPAGGPFTLEVIRLADSGGHEFESPYGGRMGASPAPRRTMPSVAWTPQRSVTGCVAAGARSATSGRHTRVQITNSTCWNNLTTWAKSVVSFRRQRNSVSSTPPPDDRPPRCSATPNRSSTTSSSGCTANRRRRLIISPRSSTPGPSNTLSRGTCPRASSGAEICTSTSGGSPFPPSIRSRACTSNSPPCERRLPPMLPAGSRRCALNGRRRAKTRR